MRHLVTYAIAHRWRKPRCRNVPGIQTYFFLSCLFDFTNKTVIVMASILTLPVDLVYCILDNLQPEDVFMSVCNVCTRFNSIIDSYSPYQVKRRPLLESSLFSLFVFRSQNSESREMNDYLMAKIRATRGDILF